MISNAIDIIGIAVAAAVLCTIGACLGIVVAIGFAS